MTEKLYHRDVREVSFDAQVVAHDTLAGRPSIVLDRTAFYPEAGGQMADRGTLAGLEIVDVQIDELDRIHHVPAPGATLPAVGATAAGRIDWARRRVHMALHTGQHMLSRALLDVARGETVSARLGESGCTIDLDREKVDDAALARAEALCNDVIDDDVEIRVFFPAPDELAKLPLRRDPKVATNVRIVQIGEFDFSPCGGTHCTRTAQVGLVRITGVERYKGKVRVTFAAGRRAREELGAHFDVLRALGKDLTCGAREVPTAIDKLRRELAEARDGAGKARARLAEAAAAELLAAAPEEMRLSACFDDADVDFLRVVGRRLTTRPGAVALLAARAPDGVRVLAARGPGATFDCGAFVKAAVAQAGGRGGGSPDRAEGVLAAGADFAALVAELG